MDTIRNRRRRHALAASALALLLLPSCSPSPAPRAGTAVAVTLRDFWIHTSTATVPAGEVRFQVHNRGPATHEFVLVRTDLSAAELPIDSDGLSVDEEALRDVGELDEVDLWNTRTLDLHLTPGRYVFFCNLEGHYLGGMRGSIVVTGGG